METQRALLFILPLIMIAVLAVGIFFGYKFYMRSVSDHGSVVHSGATEPDSDSVNPLLLRVVNSARPMTADDVPALTESCGVMVAPDAADSLRRLIQDASGLGFDLTVSEGYVSYEEQGERYQEAVRKYRESSKASLVTAEAHVRKSIPPAGESEQQTGLLVYLGDAGGDRFEDTPAYTWLIRNGVDYGFILRYPDQDNAGGVAYSPHLFRYVGEEHAYNMRVLDMNFERYIAYLSAQ